MEIVSVVAVSSNMRGQEAEEPQNEVRLPHHSDRAGVGGPGAPRTPRTLLGALSHPALRNVGRAGTSVSTTSLEELRVLREHAREAAASRHTLSTTSHKQSAELAHAHDVTVAVAAEDAAAVAGDARQTPARGDCSAEAGDAGEASDAAAATAAASPTHAPFTLRSPPQEKATNGDHGSGSNGDGGGDHVLPMMPVSPLTHPVQRALHVAYLLFADEKCSHASNAVAWAIAFTILAAIILMSVQSLPFYRRREVLNEYGTPERACGGVEAVIVAIFALDYCVRLVGVAVAPQPHLIRVRRASDVSPPPAAARRRGRRDSDASPDARLFATPVAHKYVEAGLDVPAAASSTHLTMVVLWDALQRWVAFILQPMNVIDLASFLPYVVAAGLGIRGGDSAIAIRAITLGRVLRLFRITYRTASFQLLLRALRASMFALLLLLVWLVIMTIFFSALMFYCEAGVSVVQPEGWRAAATHARRAHLVACCAQTYDPATGVWMRPTISGYAWEPSPFTSIPLTFYYVATTLTTTGYG